MRYKKLHSWNVSPKKAIEIQKKLARKITLKSQNRQIRNIASCDVSYSKTNNKVYAVVCLFAPLDNKPLTTSTPWDTTESTNSRAKYLTRFTYPELEIIEIAHHIGLSKFPYIPGLLSFRELPSLLKCFGKLKNKTHLILCDGQGIAHPRKMGIATHLGILMDIPTIGCAKSHLCGDFKEPCKSKGSYSLIWDKSKKPIGACLRTRTDVKPVFVSPGYKISIKHSVDMVLNCTKNFRIPEPLRSAHHLTQKLRPSYKYPRPGLG